MQKWRKAIDHVGWLMKRAIKSTLLGLMYIGVLLAIPGLLLGLTCDKVMNTLDKPRE